MLSGQVLLNKCLVSHYILVHKFDGYTISVTFACVHSEISTKQRVKSLRHLLKQKRLMVRYIVHSGWEKEDKICSRQLSITMQFCNSSYGR